MTDCTSPRVFSGAFDLAPAWVGSASGFVRITAQTRSAVTVTPGSAGLALGAGAVFSPVPGGVAGAGAGAVLAPSITPAAAPAAGLAGPFAAGAGDSNMASSSLRAVITLPGEIRW